MHTPATDSVKAGSAGRGRLAAAPAALLLILAFALTAAPAFAKSAYVFSTAFGAAGSTPSNPYPLSNPSAVAVDNSAGASVSDVYVTDPADHRVEKFDSSGHLLLMFGRDVDQTTSANVCTASSGDTCKAGAPASAAGAFEAPTFIAVDGSSGPSAGDVYVGDTAAHRVSKFDPSGNLIASWGVGGQLSATFNPLLGIAVDPGGNLFVLGEPHVSWYEPSGILHSEFAYPRKSSPAGLAVDAEDNLYKVDETPNVTKFSDSGADLADTLDNGSASGLSIDPSTNALYVDDERGEIVNRFALGCGENCTPLETFGGGHLSAAGGLAVRAGSGEVYAANTGAGDVAVFHTVVLPEAATEPATGTATTSTVLHGNLQPAGGAPVVDCYFEWGTHATYHNTVSCAEPGPFSGPAPVHADLTGLLAGTTYHFRLVATNAAGGTEHGQDQTFTTLGAAPERAYDSQITGITQPYAVATDLGDHVWIGHQAPTAIAEYAAYPSQATLAEQTGAGSLISPEYLALDFSDGSFYVGEKLYGLIDEFDQAGSLVPPQWAFGIGNVEGLAVDNSDGESDGVVYVTVGGATASSTPTVEAFRPGKVPADFSAREPYISGNEIILGDVPGRAGHGGQSIMVDSSGDIWVADHSGVSEFSSSGEFLRAITGAEVPGGFGEHGGIAGIAEDPTNGDVLLVDAAERFGVTTYFVDEFSSTGEYLGQLTGISPSEPFGELTGGIAVNSDGYLYVADATHETVDIFKPKLAVPRVAYQAISNPTPTSGILNATVTPTRSGEEVTSCHFDYGTNTSTGTAFGLAALPCLDSANQQVGTTATPITSETEIHAPIANLTTDTTYYYRVLVGNSITSRSGRIQRFIPRAVQALHTGPPTGVTATSAKLNGSFEGLGEDTEYYFQYGSDTGYGQLAPAPPADAGARTGPQDVTAIEISGLQPASTYHYRIVARNPNGTTYGQDQTVTTLTKPSIEGLYSSDLTPTSAVLHANIDPQGAEARYRFEYGTTTSYGAATATEEITAGLFNSHLVEASLTNLDSGATYHFRVVVESSYGTAVSEDQTFGFYPANCPNAHLRQATGSSSLPDCRAYELVSPPDAGGTTLFPLGPNSAQATNPPRFAFGGALGTIPGTGGHPSNALGDLYVATRTAEGWTTKYVGPPASQTFEANGPPDELRSDFSSNFASPAGVRTDASMDRFLDWFDGIPINKVGPYPPRSFSPHVWGADGSAEGEWPTVSGLEGSPIFETSADFTHYVFQTGAVPSLSLLDDNTTANTVSEVSRTASGPIPIQPGDTDPNEESLRVPAVSANGSHILIAARTQPLQSVEIEGHPCGLVPEGSRSPFEEETIPQVLCPLQPSQLYMRVDDSVTYEIAPGHAVAYVGMTPDGSQVFFTSDQHLTDEDTEHGGASLYGWSAQKAEAGQPPLTLISKGDNEGRPGEPGNVSNCQALWTQECGVVPYSNNSYLEQGAEGYIGGNGLSDNSIAAENGDIYFLSPEQLAGPRGANGQENLYDYRAGTGSVQYVATFPPLSFCTQEEFLNYCSPTPVIRMQVSPSDSYMAFLTAARVTSYDNAGHTEMYRYQPSTEKLLCVSCRPGGEAPATNVYASSNGIFMTNDGRAFFSTGDPLVLQDTDGLRDVYEYVEGHATLISSGTAAKDRHSVLFGENRELFTAGLVGVSAEGTDVYFSTYDTLVGQDRNVNELKFYDARTDGGFPYSPPPAPCEAADECHGSSSSAEPPAQNGSGADLGVGGNQAQPPGHRHHKHKKRHRHKRRAQRKGHLHRGGKR